MKTLKDKLSNKLVNAFLKDKIILAIPKKFTKKLIEADKFRKLCESKIKEPVIGYKAGGTGIPLLKKLKEKLSDKLVNAFLKNKIISAIPKKFTKKLTEADKFRQLCESKIKEIGRASCRERV